MKSTNVAFAASTPFGNASPVRMSAILISSTYDAKSANAVRAALPIAKPLPVAAVVLPSASNASVRCLTSAGRPLISAFPPALSAIGPYASVAKVIPKVESIPTAAMPIPYRPILRFAALNSTWKPFAQRYAKMIATPTVITGTAVESIPKPRPLMITVAGPV